MPAGAEADMAPEGEGEETLCCPSERDYTTVDPKQFALFKSKLELATPRAGRQRIAYRAGGHILRKN